MFVVFRGVLIVSCRYGHCFNLWPLCLYGQCALTFGLCASMASVACNKSLGAGMVELPPAAFLSKQKRYTVLEGSMPIARGSYGEIMRGVDQLTNLLVAIKIQKLPSKAASQELMAYAALAHFRDRHVAQMLDFGVVGTQSLAMVFELADTNLFRVWRDPLSQQGKLPVGMGKHIVGILSGAGHLHSQSIVHGDLSLSNMLVARDGRTMVADLGSCHSAHGILTREVSTTLYVTSPEHWLDGASGPSVDAWAVGVATLCLLMGAYSPIIPQMQESQQVARAALSMLGGIDESVWRGHQALSKWQTFATQFCEELQFEPYANFPSCLISVLPHSREHFAEGCAMVRLLLQWCPDRRPSCLDALRAPCFRACVVAEALGMECEFETATGSRHAGPNAALDSIVTHSGPRGASAACSASATMTAGLTFVW